MEIVAIKRKEKKVGAVGDIYQVVHKYRDADFKLCSNTYFYRRGANAVSSTPSYAQQLAEAWNTDILTPMLPTWNSSWVSYAIDVVNLFDFAEQYSLSLSRAGTRSTGEGMPSYEAVKCTMSIDNGIVKKGRKAFAGMQEGDQNAGLLNAGAIVIFTIRAALTMVQLVGAVLAGFVFQPVVVKRQKVFDSEPPIYHLPDNVGEAIYGYITAAVISAVTTTQVSRKD